MPQELRYNLLFKSSFEKICMSMFECLNASHDVCMIDFFYFVACNMSITYGNVQVGNNTISLG